MGRKHEASSVMSVLGAPKFTGGTPMEVDMERLQRTMQLLAIRKEAGLKLDPETAEVEWCYAQTLDPYRVDPDLPEQCQQIGRESPPLLQAMCGRQLRKTIRDALWNAWHFRQDAVFRQHP
jgi:hypothetical protein